MKKFTKALVLCSSLLLVSGCGEVKDPDPNGGTYDPTTNLKYFDKVIFNDEIIEYDGKMHTISPLGLPSNTIVTYLGNNSFSEIGDYKIKVRLEKDGYETKVLEAELHITLPSIKGVTIVDEYRCIYDENDHKDDIKVEIEDKENANDYEIEGPFLKKSGKKVTEAITVGTYDIHYKVNKEGFKQLHLYSKLIIEGKKITGLRLNAQNKEVPFDGNDHSNDIEVKPGLNSDLTIKKTITLSDGTVTKEVINEGTYHFKFVVSKPNYQDEILETNLIIFNNEMIKNEKNKLIPYFIQDEPTNNKLMFKDLHNKGKLTSIDSKDAEPVLMLDEEILDYTITNGIIFYKNLSNEIKYAKITDKILNPILFDDQNANLDMQYMQDKDLIYTRLSSDSTTEICKLSTNGEIKVLYSGNSISNLVVKQNKIYFLEQISLLEKTIKKISVVSNSDNIEAITLNSNIKGVVNFKVTNKRIFYLATTLLSKTIFAYNIYDTENPITKILDLNGLDIEFEINGENELIYKKSSLTENADNGIYKHFIDNKTEDILLFNLAENKMNINSLTIFKDQIYFSSKSNLDCHLYRIPAFGYSKSPVLIK